MAALVLPVDPATMHPNKVVEGNFVPKAGAAFFHPIGIATEDMILEGGGIRWDTVVASGTIAFGYILDGTAQTPTPGTGVVLVTDAIDIDGTPNAADTFKAFTPVTGTDGAAVLAGSQLKEKIPRLAAFGFFTNQTGMDAMLNVSYQLTFARARFSY